MFAKYSVKQEIDDKSYEQSCHQINNLFGYESKILASKQSKSPPKKKIKIDIQIRDPRLLKHRSNSCAETESVPKVECKPEIGVNWCPKVPKIVTKSEGEVSLTNKPLITSKLFAPEICLCPTKTLYENVLQEIFQWSPEWLQGSVKDKPPIIQLEKQLKQNSFKLEYSREEYVSRHLPYIMRELFIKLSDTFKNEAPSRSEHLIFINDCENTGHLQMNRLLICYCLRDSRSNLFPFKVNDMIIISMKVMTGKVIANKKYFGIISSHSMLEFNDLEPHIIDNYEKLTDKKLDKLDRHFMLWDRLTILTKRAQNSVIIPKQLAKIDIILNAGIELSLIRNLLNKNPKSTKLLSNIFSANANIHQFSSEELDDFRTISKTLVKNAVEMIDKCNPMIFIKGINNLMVVDISDSVLRFKYLCEIALKSIYASKSGEFRVLVITSKEQISTEWYNRLRHISFSKTLMRPWYLDKGRGWTRHVDVSRFVTNNAKNIYESLGSKLRHVKESDDKTYQELARRKQIYQEIKDVYAKSRDGTIIRKNVCQSSNVMIAKEELYSKGFIQLLNDNNVIIGTFYDVLNCQQLFSERSKPFDCCIIDDSHLLTDAYIMSIIHLGITTIVIGGDSEHRTHLSDDLFSKQYKYDFSLFDRIVKKYLNFT